MSRSPSSQPQGLEGLGFEVDRTEAATFPGFVRLHARDGHGNRVELLVSL